MGTNFYMRHDNRNKIIEAVNRYDFETARTLMDESELHIAKTSCGWLPLFEANDNWSSVAEMHQYYIDNNCDIIDEYGEVYTWDEFDKRVLQFNGGIDGVIPKTKVDRIIDTGMPPWTPVSHFDTKYRSHYTKDLQGYEFMRGEFC